MATDDLDELEAFFSDSELEYNRVCNRHDFDISDKDLNAACSFLISGGYKKPSRALEPPHPLIKAARNHLDSSKKTIARWMKLNFVVESYINDRQQDEDHFPERLRESFLAVYDQLAGRRDNRLSGDELFEGIVDELTNTEDRLMYRPAVEALLVYFFARCEVFPPKPGEQEEVHDTTI